MHLLHNVDNDNSFVAAAADVAPVHPAGERLTGFGATNAIAIAIASPLHRHRQRNGSGAAVNWEDRPGHGRRHQQLYAAEGAKGAKGECTSLEGWSGGGSTPEAAIAKLNKPTEPDPLS